MFITTIKLPHRSITMEMMRGPSFSFTRNIARQILYYKSTFINDLLTGYDREQCIVFKITRKMFTKFLESRTVFKSL